MEESAQANKLLPEVSLIGALLLIYGGLGTLSNSYSLWKRLTLPPRISLHQFGGLDVQIHEIPKALTYTWEILGILLAIASLVCGLALLRHAPWARRAAVTVIIAQIGVHLISAIVNHVIRQGGLSLHVFGSMPFPIFAVLLRSLSSIVMLIILELPRTRTDFGEEQVTNGRLMLVAEKIMGYLTRAVPAVVALIALFLLSHAIPAVISLGMTLVNLGKFRSMLSTVDIKYTTALAILFAIGSLLSSFGLLFHIKGARYITIGFLCIAPSLPLSAALFFHGNILLLSSAFTLASGSIPYVVMAVYLLKYRNSVQG